MIQAHLIVPEFMLVIHIFQVGQISIVQKPWASAKIQLKQTVQMTSH